MKTKVNIGLTPSKNYQKVNIELLEHEIEYESDLDFQKELRRLFKLIRAEALHQLESWDSDWEFSQKVKQQKKDESAIRAAGGL